MMFGGFLVCLGRSGTRIKIGVVRVLESGTPECQPLDSICASYCHPCTRSTLVLWELGGKVLNVSEIEIRTEPI